MNEPIPSESIEVPHSEPEGTPSEETPSENPVVEPEVPEAPAVIEPETPSSDLYELPDGRKVDGATLAKEWKENFLPDYTRKSQELAGLKSSDRPLTTEDKPVNPYADPDYVPQTYQEIIDAAKAAAIAELKAEEKAVADAHKALEDMVISQLDAVKQIDPNVNEDKLFLHANKYGFRDLTHAYQNMKDMGQVVKTVQKQTVENMNKRKDPVSISQGASLGSAPDPSAFSSAVDYMRSLQSK
jgi:hypothetical protein